jgi:cobalt/nickel transport protein
LPPGCRAVGKNRADIAENRAAAQYAARFLSLTYRIIKKGAKMKKLHAASMTAAIAALLAGNAFAHFGMVIPSENIVTPEKKNVTLDVSFSHPFELKGMDLAKPKQFYMVSAEGEKTDLLPALKESKIMGHKAWQEKVDIKRPGVYTFVMEPHSYWEPAEDLSIIHYTKTIIAAFGDDQGWDKPVGIETEIVPLTRPFGNYAGNSFSGQVLLKGKPVPGAEVEVELYNKDGKFEAPSDYHVTQVVKADENGVFSFTCPQPGWWGFAALNEADYKVKDPDGNDKGVEIGAVLWLHLDEYKTK